MVCGKLNFRMHVGDLSFFPFLDMILKSPPIPFSRPLSLSFSLLPSPPLSSSFLPSISLPLPPSLSPSLPLPPSLHPSICRCPSTQCACAGQGTIWRSSYLLQHTIPRDQSHTNSLTASLFPDDHHAGRRYKVSIQFPWNMHNLCIEIKINSMLFSDERVHMLTGTFISVDLLSMVSSQQPWPFCSNKSIFYFMLKFTMYRKWEGQILPVVLALK